uniref:Odorant receptor n=1 Tax=Colaphellus bowringi TaxID=561076 RepID=A0A0S3J3D3_9CUCU|nr:odorant receptor OR10 [Colaphellus bowringi]
MMVKQTKNEAKRFFRYIGMLFTPTQALGCYVLLRIKQHGIEKVREELLDEQFHYKSCGSFRPGKIFNDAKSFCDKFVVITIILYSLVVASAHISAYVTLNLAFEGEYFPANITCYDFMPNYFVIPFPTPTKSSCKNALTYMDVSLNVYATLLASYDTTFCSVLICFKTKLQILSGAMRSMRERVTTEMNLPLNSSLELDDPEVEAKLYEEIKQCARHLESLLSVCKQIEDIFKYGTLMQIVNALVIISSCMFVLSITPQSDPDFFVMIHYIIALFVQLFTVCYFGNEITEVADELNNSLYQSNWLSCSKRHKQCMIIMMSRMQKKIHVMIGKFSPLTMNMFVAVVKGALSYCAVFRAVDNAEI